MGLRGELSRSRILTRRRRSVTLATIVDAVNVWDHRMGSSSYIAARIDGSRVKETAELC